MIHTEPSTPNRHAPTSSEARIDAEMARELEALRHLAELEANPDWRATHRITANNDDGHPATHAVMLDAPGGWQEHEAPTVHEFAVGSDSSRFQCYDDENDLTGVRWLDGDYDPPRPVPAEAVTEIDVDTDDPPDTAANALRPYVETDE